MPEFREIIVRQVTQLGTGLAASSIRNNRTKGPEPAKAAEPDRPALRAAQELIERNKHAEAETSAAAGLEPGIPAGLFDPVEGRAEEKALLERALRSSSPVHVLLVGDPGCGKSELLQQIAKLPGSRYAVGGATSSSGMLDYLLEKPNTRYLVIDELDKADSSDLYALYSLMESGTAPRLQHGKTEVLQWKKGWVFAAGNTTDKLPEALASRFVIRKVPNYTPAEVEQIVAKLLEKREGLPRARAREIAAAVAPLSQDPRDGIQVGRLAGPTGPIEPVLAEVLPGR